MNATIFFFPFPEHSHAAAAAPFLVKMHDDMHGQSFFMSSARARH
jgi:hypothetical protein